MLLCVSRAWNRAPNTCLTRRISVGNQWRSQGRLQAWRCEAYSPQSPPSDTEPASPSVCLPSLPLPAISNRFPIYDAAATSARTTVYGLPSLAATSIASRTSFVVCVPIASATPPSLQGQAGFTHALRAITALSVPHSVADGCVPTPSGSHVRFRHGHSTRSAKIYAYTFHAHCIIT